YNATLLRMLAEEVAPRPLFSSAALGVAPEQVEALAFAWLARECLARRCGNLPAVTGAEGPRVLGCLYAR
ncbi:MAG: anhydro-N-acetylmuramic acid kinase, partial [Burkholderiaceae bacterium]|nr:anhydro-N-acetylmuramic acid kinase [Burkholderiaceae bacterium]